MILAEGLVMDKYEYAWLNITGGFQAKKINTEKYSYKEIFGMTEEVMLTEFNISKKEADYLIRKIADFDMCKEYEEFLESAVSVVEYGKEGYPEKLLNIPYPPKALFYYGELPEEGGRSVAIIGARECSEYGRHMAKMLASGLAKEGVQIISGMAVGIDGISQMCAINAGGKSFGVLGSGVDICYPRANKALYERLKNEGGVISEYPNKTPARAANFPMRNRIISGLCDGIIVVEAKIKSGTMITVDAALSQGKEIMVVPGRATDPLSVGCNALIYQGANPVQCVDDVMNLMDGVSDRHYEKEYKVKKVRNIKTEDIREKEEKFEFSEDERLIYDLLDFYPINVEEIVRKSKMDFNQVMSVVIRLEMMDAVKERGKNYYVRV